MESARRFRQLDVWNEAMSLARAIYRFTATFPSAERFGLIAQLRRAAVSVPSNIAEGSVRRSRKQFCHYLEIALGSLAEIETQLEIASDFVKRDDALTEIQERMMRTRKMLYRLMTVLESQAGT